MNDDGLAVNVVDGHGPRLLHDLGERVYVLVPLSAAEDDLSCIVRARPEQAVLGGQVAHLTRFGGVVTVAVIARGVGVDVARIEMRARLGAAVCRLVAGLVGVDVVLKPLAVRCSCQVT